MNENSKTICAEHLTFNIESLIQNILMAVEHAYMV